MRKISILLAVLTWTLSAFAMAPAPLAKEQKSKILFMLFENQNRKTVAADPKSDCTKTNTGAWFCENNTVKKFLMNSLGIDAAEMSRHNTIQCSEITDENRKTLSDDPELGPNPLEFKREISQALKGQFVCHYTYTLQPTAGEAHTVAAGLSFLMNRNLDRIISKKIVAWSH